MQLKPGSTRAGRTSPGPNQRCRWSGRREQRHRITRNAEIRLTRSRRKMRSCRTRTHPGRASSVEPIRPTMLVGPGRGSRAGTPFHNRHPLCPLVRANHWNRRRPWENLLLRRPLEGPPETNPPVALRLCPPRKEKPLRTMSSRGSSVLIPRVLVTEVMLRDRRRRSRAHRPIGRQS
jgi:hypothetical protein